MTEYNRDIFKKVVTRMPRYQLKNDTVWEHIEKSLDNLIRKLPDLPGYVAPEGLWNSIESRLPTEKSQEVRAKLWSLPLRTKLTMAAGMLILLGTGLLVLLNPSQPDEVVMYSVESTDNESVENISTGDEAQNYLNTLLVQHCKNNLPVCASVEFKDLQQELQKIDREYDELKSQIMKSRDNQLYQYLYRIENEKMEIQKELLDMLKKS